MDRWGPSVDCHECGQACSQVEIVICPLCEQSMCSNCLHEHQCYRDMMEED